MASPAGSIVRAHEKTRRSAPAGRAVEVMDVGGMRASRGELAGRSVRDAGGAARLSQPHRDPIHPVGEGLDGLVYFVMGYVDAESVAAKHRRRGCLPAEESRRIM